MTEEVTIQKGESSGKKHYLIKILSHSRQSFEKSHHPTHLRSRSVHTLRPSKVTRHRSGRAINVGDAPENIRATMSGTGRANVSDLERASTIRHQTRTHTGRMHGGPTIDCRLRTQWHGGPASRRGSAFNMRYRTDVRRYAVVEAILKGRSIRIGGTGSIVMPTRHRSASPPFPFFPYPRRVCDYAFSATPHQFPRPCLML